MFNVKISAADVSFEERNNQLYHNLDADYACFAIWKNALPHLDKIREHLSSRFEILFETKVIWSHEHLNDNIARIYEVPIYSNIPKKDRKCGHVLKMGSNSFVLLILKDTSPSYTYAVSVSGKVEITNMNFVKSKYTFRDWAKQENGTNYAVHSTNNIFEFLYQAPLILGCELLQDLLEGKKIKIDVLEKDLEGANGWKNWKELFDVLKYSSNYLVLRNFEELPLKNSDADIDFLTDNYQRMASIMAVEQSNNKPYKGVIKVADKVVPVDIRFVGDKYYDATWQKDMLIRKSKNNNIYIPRKDDYFFSLLYHCIIQKLSIKPKYKQVLSLLAEDLGFDWFKNMEFSETKLSKVIGGYYSANNYYYEPPLDNFVLKNKKTLLFLPTKYHLAPKETLQRKIKRNLIKALPKNVISILQKTLRRIK